MGKKRDFLKEWYDCYDQLAPTAVLAAVEKALKILEVSGVSPVEYSDLKALLPGGIDDVETIENTPGIELEPTHTRSGREAFRIILPEEGWEPKIYQEKDGEYRLAVGYETPEDPTDVLDHNIYNWFHIIDFFHYFFKETFKMAETFPNPDNAENYGGFCVDDMSVKEKLAECEQKCGQ